MNFEIPYAKPADQKRLELMQEQREVARDKTYVTPRAIYSTKTY